MVDSASTELALFGAPPENPIIEKTDTVIHRQWKNDVCDIQTPYNVAKFNLAGPAVLFRDVSLVFSIVALTVSFL